MLWSDNLDGLGPPNAVQTGLQGNFYLPLGEYSSGGSRSLPIPHRSSWSLLGSCDQPSCCPAKQILSLNLQGACDPARGEAHAGQTGQLASSQLCAPCCPSAPAFLSASIPSPCELLCGLPAHPNQGALLSSALLLHFLSPTHCLVLRRRVLTLLLMANS